MSKDFEAWNPADCWQSHPKYPRSDWRYEVGNDDTTLGYVEWVNHQIESHTSSFEIARMLVLSTEHISLETSRWLEEDSRKNVERLRNPGGPLGVLNSTSACYGWIVDFPQNDKCREDLDIPADLKVVFNFAASMGCNYVYFDRDGEVYDELPTFDW